MPFIELDILIPVDESPLNEPNEDEFLDFCGRLWAGAVLDAMDNLRSNDQMDRRKAFAFFNSDFMAAGSFRWICDMFNMDYQLVRKRIFDGLKRNPTSIEFKQELLVFWGKPCTKDKAHIFYGKTKRYRKNGHCVACHTEANRLWRENNKK